jgi:ElaB/YqjD/DUF883 family membrane-anchored ribosome-binding protein
MTHDDDPLLADDERRPEDIERGINRTRANLSDTLDAISSKLTPGQMMDQALQYMRTSLPADFSSNLADSVRNNPVPVALIGVGIAWMAMSGRRGSLPRRARYDDDGLGYAANTGYAHLGGDDLLGTGSTADSTLSAGASTIDSVKDKARDLKQQAQAGLGSARERVADTLSSTRDRVSSTMASTRDRVGSTVASARESMSHLSERSAQTYDRARDSFTSMVEEQPLLLAALGVAVGAAVGAALPRTRQEDALLGETRDDLLQRAGSTARSYADQAADKARNAVQTVTDKAHRALDERSEHATAASGGGAGGSGAQDRPWVTGEAAARASAGGGTSGTSGTSGPSDRTSGSTGPSAGRPGANTNDDAVTIRTTNVHAASSSTNDERPR